MYHFCSTSSTFNKQFKKNILFQAVNNVFIMFIIPFTYLANWFPINTINRTQSIIESEHKYIGHPRKVNKIYFTHTYIIGFNKNLLIFVFVLRI
jgi:hypothetical protein